MKYQRYQNVKLFHSLCYDWVVWDEVINFFLCCAVLLLLVPIMTLIFVAGRTLHTCADCITNSKAGSTTVSPQLDKMGHKLNSPPDWREMTVPLVCVWRGWETPDNWGRQFSSGGATPDPTWPAATRLCHHCYCPDNFRWNMARFRAHHTTTTTTIRRRHGNPL